jgi:hypothetical protein
MPPIFVTTPAGDITPVKKELDQTKPGLHGIAPQDGPGVEGNATTGDGVQGWSDSGAGVSGTSNTGPAFWGWSKGGEGLFIQTDSPSAYAIHAQHKSNSGNGGGIYVQSDSGQAGYFKGPVTVDGRIDTTGNLHVRGQIDAGGDITCANGSDCAEYFDVARTELADPGTVMVLGDHGALFESRSAYDKRVAGVVSGAGAYKPGIILDKRPQSDERKAIALVGKVFCKVDASYGHIEVGDLLTTSLTPGHAMKASDRQQAFGAVLGKALQPLNGGKALIPILVALQ